MEDDGSATRGMETVADSRQWCDQLEEREGGNERWMSKDSNYSKSYSQSIRHVRLNYQSLANIIFLLEQISSSHL
jgi:hypothetical protein